MLEPIYPDWNDERGGTKMHSSARRTRPSTFYTGPLRREIICDALEEIQARWFVAIKRDELNNSEIATVESRYVSHDGDVSAIHFALCLMKTRRQRIFFWKKQTMVKKLLEITDWYHSQSRLYERTSLDEPMRCEYFSRDLWLLDITDRILSHLAERLGYTGVKYIDNTYLHPSAWYSYERPGLPVARLLTSGGKKV